MQKDMHYYGVFALARAAGIKEEHAKTIATASQFVDDNVVREVIEFQDIARFSVHVSGHHALNRKNLDLDDQRKVWIPFHFLPGNEGDSYTERLICRKNSIIAKEMASTYTGLTHLQFVVELIGVAAHVYADTFAHYGFSGISSRRNFVDDINYEAHVEDKMKEYLSKKFKTFMEKFGQELSLPNIKDWLTASFPKTAGGIIEAAQRLVPFSKGALGHAAAATLPDRPYLIWSYKTEYPEKKAISRNNPQDFMEGCQALYDMFCSLADNVSDISAGDRKDFSAFEIPLKAIIEFQGTKEDRIAAWQDAVKKGDIYDNGPPSIKDYDLREWPMAREGLKYMHDSSDAVNEVVFRFYQAVSFHRNYVIRTLLPKHRLVVH